jgi:hypothetical protein
MNKQSRDAYQLQIAEFSRYVHDLMDDKKVDASLLKIELLSVCVLNTKLGRKTEDGNLLSFCDWVYWAEIIQGLSWN